MLKKIFISCALLLGATQISFSQFQIGANLGAVSASTNLNPLGREVSSLSGFYPELQAGYRFSNYFSANMGVGYMQRGFKEQPEGEGERSVRIRYFDIPVYADVHIPFLNKFSAGALVGLQFNIYNSIAAPAPFNIDFQQMRNPVGLLCGAQFGYNLTEKLQLHMQYRYESDFVNADDDEYLGRFHTNQFLIGITYTIQPKVEILDTHE